MRNYEVNSRFSLGRPSTLISLRVQHAQEILFLTRRHWIIFSTGRSRCWSFQAKFEKKKKKKKKSARVPVQRLTKWKSLKDNNYLKF